MTALAASRPSFIAVRFALRELRHGLRGFGVFIACIALGVAAIAGVGSFSRSLGDGLARAVQFAGQPVETSAGVRLAAGNLLGDAVIAYGLTQGALWRKIGPPPSPAPSLASAGHVRATALTSAECPPVQCLSARARLR